MRFITAEFSRLRSKSARQNIMVLERDGDQGSQKSGQSGFDLARDWTVLNRLWKSRPIWTRHFRAGPRCLSGPG
jgi:hypothetical protein